MMNDEKELLRVVHLTDNSEVQVSSLSDENNSHTGDISSHLSSAMIADISNPNTTHHDLTNVVHVDVRSDESPHMNSGMNSEVTTNLNNSVNSDMTVLLNRNMRTHVASDVNLGSLGDMSDNLAVTDAHMDNQLKVDGALSNTPTTLLPENMILFETSKGLVLSVANLDGLNFSSSFVSTTADSRGQTILTQSLPGTIFPQIQLVTAGDDSSTVYETASDGSLLIPSVIFPENDTSADNTQNTQQFVVEEIVIDKPKKKGTGGWPKGKKRKSPPKVITPRKPMTGYVIFAVRRRHELKASNPELGFPEVTKLMGQEWSDLINHEKEKYLQQAEEDKRRYINEMRDFQNSEQYLNYVKSKRLAGGTLNGLPDNSNKPLIDVEDNVGDELFCKLCDKYFISTHNKKEHMFGSQHLQNITNEITKNIEEQTELQRQQMLLASHVTYTEPHHALVKLDSADVHHSEADSLDIDQFIQQFLEKNTGREQEIKSLRKTHRLYEQDNITMSKRIKELEEYESKLDQDMGSLKAYGASLSAQVEVLKMVPTLFGVINF